MQILYETDAGVLQIVEFDATVKEIHGASAVATEHFVEEGVAITDHVRPERQRLSVEVHVTNTPVRPPNVDGAEGTVQPFQLEKKVTGFESKASVSSTGEVTDAVRNSNDSTLQANVLQFPAEFDRVTAVHEKLLTLMGQGDAQGAVELTVFTSLRQYDAMVIVDLGAPRDAASANAVLFSLELVEIRKAVSETVAAPETLETRAERAQRLGAQSTEDPEAGDDRSLAAALVEDQAGQGLITSNRPNGNSLFR